jgi:hypothetical protein
MSLFQRLLKGGKKGTARRKKAAAAALASMGATQSEIDASLRDAEKDWLKATQKKAGVSAAIVATAVVGGAVLGPALAGAGGAAGAGTSTGVTAGAALSAKIAAGAKIIGAAGGIAGGIKKFTAKPGQTSDASYENVQAAQAAETSGGNNLPLLIGAGLLLAKKFL